MDSMARAKAITRVLWGAAVVAIIGVGLAVPVLAASSGSSVLGTPDSPRRRAAGYQLWGRHLQNGTPIGH